MRFLVTAGNTREKIDRVRDWGNIFTGNTGLGIARALMNVDEVDLLTSNRLHLDELAGPAHLTPNLRALPFTTHAELRESLESLMQQHAYDAIFMTAAVADYTPAGVFELIAREEAGSDGVERWVVRSAQAGKVKSIYPAIAVVGRKTEKLVDLFRSRWKHRGLLVKFKLEVGIEKEDLIRIGQASRKASRAEYLVANTLEMTRGPGAGAFLLSDAGDEWVPREKLAERMVKLASHPSPSPSGRGSG